MDPAYDQLAYEVSNDLTEARTAAYLALDAAWEPRRYPNCPAEKFLATAEQELGQRFRDEVPKSLLTAGPDRDWPYY